MSLFGRFWNRLFGARPARAGGDAPRPRASFDAAKTTDENRNHWANADALGANAAANPGVRATLRNRSRYEAANNGYVGGMIRGRANATIGVCPRLQLTLPGDPAAPGPGADPLDAPEGPARKVERLWCLWADAVGLADKLRVMDRSETREGETFAVLGDNPALADLTGGVRFDFKVVEADQVSTPNFDPMMPGAVDGVEFDGWGNPTYYHVLRYHPGEWLTWNWAVMPWEYDRLPAWRVLHVYDWDRAGQRRGVPALSAGLPLAAILRRYTLASLGAAELAAMIAGVIESDLPADGSEAPEIEAMDRVPFARNALLTMPAGQTAKAFPPAQPAPSYKEFKSEILTEMGRGVDAPRNTATGSSADYNYSSGRLDKIPEQQGYQIRRDRWRRLVLDVLFRNWAAEASLLPGYLPDGLPPVAEWNWGWRWDGFGSIDPVKDATAGEILLASGQTTLERVCAERGDDWEEVLRQQAREMKLRDALGLPSPVAAKAKPQFPAEAARGSARRPAGPAERPAARRRRLRRERGRPRGACPPVRVGAPGPSTRRPTLTATESAMNDLVGLTVPHFARLHDFFGAWLYEPERFLAQWAFLSRVDWAEHLRAGPPKVASNTTLVAGKGGKQLAMIQVVGTLAKGESSFGGTSSVQLRRDIRQAASDPNVSGILLAIDSPGGTVAGTADLAADVRAAASKKPVFAHIDDLGASAAYWIASQAERVTANAPTALVGSIGTIMTVYDASAAAEAEGVKTLVFATGPLKGAGTPGSAVTDEQRSYFQGIVDATQASFDKAVRTGRRLNSAQMSAVRTGGVWLASEAQQLGLIDAIQPLEKTLAELSAAAK
jgi:lambda family phage portal protein